jgi:transcriptional regulator with XRE-family HTH domain
MATRERFGDLGVADARQHEADAAREIRLARRTLGLSQAECARRAGMSASQLARIERGGLDAPTLEQLCRAARAAGLSPWFKLYPDDGVVVDRGQLAVAARFEAMLKAPLRMAREVPLPIPGDLRAWDGRVTDGRDHASVEVVARIEDCQALARRIALKARDDPDPGPILLVLNRTRHNREVLRLHRESLRGQFPLDGGAIARPLRRGEVPRASGIILV